MAVWARTIYKNAQCQSARLITEQDRRTLETDYLPNGIVEEISIGWVVPLRVTRAVEGKEGDLPVDWTAVALERDGRVVCVARQLTRNEKLGFGAESERVAEVVERRWAGDGRGWEQRVQSRGWEGIVEELDR